MSSITDSVNDNDENLIRGFDASTSLCDSVYDVFENDDGIITDDSNVWVNTNRVFGKGGSLQSLTVTYRRIPIIKTNMNSYKKLDMVLIKNCCFDHNKNILYQLRNINIEVLRVNLNWISH